MSISSSSGESKRIKGSRKYCGPQLVSKVRDLTTACYKHSLNEILDEHNITQNVLFRHEVEMVLKHVAKYRLIEPWWLEANNLTEKEVFDIKEKTDSRYLEKLCSLSSKQIEDILWAHEKGRIVRAPRTVEQLASELARRFLLGDK